MRVPAALALVALVLAAPGQGRAQWRATPMVVPAPAGADALAGRFAAASAGDELLVVDPATGAGVVREHRALLAPTRAYPYTLAAGTPVRAGRTRGNLADAVSEVAYGQGTNVWVGYTAPAFAAQLVPRPGTTGAVVAFAHVMPHGGDTLVFPSPAIDGGSGFVDVWDFESTTLGGNALAQSFAANGLGALETGPREIFGVRLSPAALAHGIDDLAMPTQGGVLLHVHAPATGDLRYALPLPAFPWELTLEPVAVGGVSSVERPAWLPASVSRKGDALGAAALDLDGDGAPDLVFSYGSRLDVADGAGGFLPNHLVAVRGGGDPRALATGTWEDVTGLAALQPLRDPATLRQVSVGGAPGVALWDRDLDEVVVLWREAGGLTTWRGSAMGRQVRDLRVGDLVGSTAPDLVVTAEDVLVYPDVGDASPVLAWSGGGPGPAVRGEDLALAVAASDADGDVTLEWFLGDPYGAPLSPATLPGSGAIGQHLVSRALLCEPPPQTVAVTVRATDALGVYAELSAAVPVVLPPPSLALSGALPAGRLVLPPGGTTAVFEGSGRGGCAPSLAFTWGGAVLDAAASSQDETTATTARRTLALPEESYAALLAAAEPRVTLAAADGAVESAPAVLPLHLDAEGLVEVVHASDVSSLAPGEVALLTTVVRSRLGVPLPGVRVADLLRGLAPAGAPRVVGAAVSATARDGAELVLEALPGGGAEVVIELPVRAAGARGASGVELRSSGGHLVSAPAAPDAPDGSLPGCGCGGGAAGAEALVVLAALALARRRRPPAT